MAIYFCATKGCRARVDARNVTCPNCQAKAVAEQARIDSYLLEVRDGRRAQVRSHPGSLAARAVDWAQRNGR